MRPAPFQTSYFIGSYKLHYLLFSGIGALLCHDPYCFPSQSQTLFGLSADRPIHLPYQYRPLCKNNIALH